MKNIKFLFISVLLFMTIAVYSDEFNTTLRLAQQGNIAAQFNLALMYSNGEGVTQDDGQAVYWYRKAANQGDAASQNNLGLKYEYGKGVTQDYNQAVYWFQKAANQGNVYGQYNLGTMYEKGRGVTQDNAQALYWYRKAAEQGNASAQSNIASLYIQGNGVKKDYYQSMMWYKKAAENGHANAQCNLGEGYQFGKGVVQDYSQAVYWYRKAAEQENRFAQCFLGNLYYEGKGIEQDFQKALEYYFESISDSSEIYFEPLYRIGTMYEKGHCVKQNYEEAMRWYRKAREVYTNLEKLGVTFYDFEQDRNAEIGKSINDSYNRLASLGYKETPKTLPVMLNIDRSSIVFGDANGNNIIDAQEECFILFDVRNDGNDNGLECKADIKMIGTMQGISITPVNLNTIFAGETRTVKIPIYTNMNTQIGKVTFNIEVVEKNGLGTATLPITIQTNKFFNPMIKVVDYSVNAKSGKLSKREPFDIQIMLQNVEAGTANDVNIEIITPDNVLLYEGKRKNYFAKIKSGETQLLTYSLIVSNNYVSDVMPITFKVSEKLGKYAENMTINLELNQPALAQSINIAGRNENFKSITLSSLRSEVDRNIPISSTKNPNTFVLVLANEHYQQVATVPFALNDGNIFREYCIKTLGISDKHIKYFSDATGNQLKAGINWLANLTEAFDNPQIIVYYAGHGIPDESSKTAYLLPVDGIISDMSTCYKLDDLYTTLGNMPASQITVFMDACFSGSKREDGMIASARGVALRVKSGVPQGNMVVFSAAQGDETAYPNREQQHGLFTYYLLKKLQETQGDIALKDLGDYITKQVSQQSLLLNSKKQTPCVTPSVTLGDQWQNWKLK